MLKIKIFEAGFVRVATVLLESHHYSDGGVQKHMAESKDIGSFKKFPFSLPIDPKWK